MRRLLNVRTFAKIFLLILTMLLITSFAALTYFQSKILRDHVLPRLIELVEKSGKARLAIGDLHIHFLGGLQMDDIHLFVATESLQAQMRIREIDVRYNLKSLFSNSIEIFSIRVDSPKITVVLTPNSNPSKSSSEENLRELATSFEKLPRGVRINEIQISDLSFTTEVRTDAGKTTVQAEDASVRFKANLDPTGLRLVSDFDLPKVEIATPKFSSRFKTRASIPIFAKIKKDAKSGWGFQAAPIKLSLTAQKSSPSLAFLFDSLVIESLCDLQTDLETTNVLFQTDLSHGQMQNSFETLRLTSTGTFSTQEKAGALSGELNLISMSSKASLDRPVQGSVRIPWKFEVQGNRTIQLTSVIEAHGFSFHHERYRIEDLNADIPIRLSLTNDAHQGLRLSKLLTRNPFERADYLTLRPYFAKSKNNFRLRKLSLGSTTIGPISANLSLQQNYLMAEDYQMDFLDGRMTGRAFVDVAPENRRLGFLGRFSGLNPKLLFAKSSSPNDRRISSRLALIYSFDRSTADGRMDITEMGGPQLVDLINLVDPEFKDPKAVLARSLLKVAYPKYVGIKMSQGFMDLNLTLGGLVSLSNIGLFGIPLSSVLSISKQRMLSKFRRQKE